MAGIPAYFGKAIATDDPVRFDIVTEYVNEAGMRYLLRTASELTGALAAGKDFPVQERIAEARAVANRSGLGPSTRGR